MPEDPRVTIAATGIVSSLVKATGLRTARCRISTGAEAGRAVLIGGRPVQVGADRQCDVILSDAKVSRNHAELRLAPSGIQVRDLGSTNGTWYQGSRISEAEVPLGGSSSSGS